VFTFKFAVQPGTGKRPLVLHRRWRQIQRGSGLGNGQPGEVTQRDDPGLAFVNRLQLLERIVQRDQIRAVVIGLRCGQPVARNK